ncbi:Aste57867_21742 [Aphanomyces stellatus]|uniref:Aste57867_21742 protein n=1 Tax=Aphanomyces stellatus TaxID=120398 RepID=A0A485LJ07_9STRA|nr:hypothetical protein As57867_021673 [Aphanomyces stellatus]VFT98411.1 Aste57867_21742 [Aphanomyces stellatus]
MKPTLKLAARSVAHAMLFATDLLTDVAAARWPTVLAHVTAHPELAGYIDVHGLTLLHYLCMHPLVPVDTVAAYVRIAPHALDALDHAKRLFTVAKCSPDVRAYLAALGYPKSVRRPPELPPRWQEAAECSLCHASFNVIKRRHHCRQCGNSVCGRHARRKAKLAAYGLAKEHRVCDLCFQTGPAVSYRPSMLHAPDNQRDHEE